MALEAYRGISYIVAYTFPESLDITGYVGRCKVYDGIGGDVLLDFDQNPTPNGSVVLNSDNSIVVTIAVEDLDSLPLGDDEASPFVGAIDILLTNTSGDTMKLKGGAFRIWPYGSATKCYPITICVENCGNDGCNVSDVNVIQFMDTGPYVRFIAQELTEEQQEAARTNIGIGDADKAVLFIAQTLTDDQKRQARVNLDLDGATGSMLPVEHWGYTDGDDDNITAVFEAACEAGVAFRLSSYKTYYIRQAIQYRSGTKIYGDPTSKIVMLPQYFDNEYAVDGDGNSNLYKSNSCGVRMIHPDGISTPLEDVGIVGVNIEWGGGDGYVVDAIAGRNIIGLNANGNKISGFPMSKGIRLSSIRPKSTGSDVQRCSIKNNIIADFYIDQEYLKTDGTRASVQLTAIEIDGDRVSGLSSYGFDITDNYIMNLKLGDAALAIYSFPQTDGINIAGANADSSLATRDFSVVRNQIRQVGEGVDCFGSYGDISHNIISETYSAGIKIIHTASYNSVSRNVIRDTGLWGIVLAHSPFGDVQNNFVENNIISGVDHLNYWGAGGGIGARSACISTEGNFGSVGYPKNNVIRENYCDPGEYGKFAIYGEIPEPANENLIEDNRIGKGLRGRLSSRGDLKVTRNYNLDGTETYDCTQSSVNSHGRYIANSSTYLDSTTPSDYEWADSAYSQELGILAVIANAAGGSNDHIMTTNDGITFTLRSIGVDVELGAIAWIGGNHKFFIAGASSGSGTNRIFKSSNGVTWTGSQVGSIVWRGFAYSPELDVIVGIASGGIYTSYDGGDTWTQTLGSGNPRSIVWSSCMGKFVVVGEGGKAWRSLDATQWTERLGSLTSDLYSVVWVQRLKKFFAVGYSGGAQSSEDGDVWETITSIPANNWRSVVDCPEIGTLIAVSTGGTSSGEIVACVDDLDTWQSMTYPADRTWWNVNWMSDAGLVVVAARSGTTSGTRIATSKSAYAGYRAS